MLGLIVLASEKEEEEKDRVGLNFETALTSAGAGNSDAMKASYVHCAVAAQFFFLIWPTTLQHNIAPLPPTKIVPQK